MSSGIPIISIVAAKSGSGKTTLLEKLIKELKLRGYRVGAIKHDAHDFEIDIPKKDSWRYAKAGADAVAISSSKKVALIEKITEEKTLDDIANYITDVDIILTEGFRREDKPKIEVFRSKVSERLLCDPKELLALASDIEWDIEAPCYSLDDYVGIADEIIKHILLHR